MSVQTDKLSDDVLYQDQPVGGEVNGETPRMVVPVLPTGIVTVREVPALRAQSGAVALAAGSFHRIGEDPHRRRITIRCNDAVAPAPATFRYLVVATSIEAAQSGFGLELTPGTSVELFTAAQLVVAAIGDTLRASWFGIMDQG